MTEICAELGGLAANVVIVLLFYKLVWPFIRKGITIIDSALLTLLLGFLIKDKIFKGVLHPVFIILIFAGLFIGFMWLMHTKIGFLVSALFMSYIWTELIVGEISKHWESYDLIWGVFLCVCTFAISLYFHWRDYSSVSTAV